MVARLKKISIVMILVSLLFMSPAEAATIKLKLQSGRIMEGEVTERTDDYIKIKNDKGEYKVQLKLIDEEGTQELNNVAEEKKEIVTDKTQKDWEAWMEANKTYFKQTDQLRVLYLMSISRSTQAINQALANNDIPSAGQAAEKNKTEILGLIQQIDRLTPPEGLNVYQQKMREAFLSAKKSMDVWALGDQQGYHQHRKKALRALLAAFQELRDAYLIMGATPGYIDVLDQEIQEFKDKIGKIYR